MSYLPARIDRTLPVFLPAALAVVAAVAVGVAMGAGGMWTVAGSGGALAVLIAGGMARASQRVFRPLYVEVPALLLLVANLSLRARDASALAENPLDTAGLIKLGGTALALLIGLFAILTPRKNPSQTKLTTLPLNFYVLYVLVAAMGVLVSRMPFLTGYRVLGVIATLVVIFGALRSVGGEALPRLEKLLIRWAQAILVVAWAAVFVAPGIALEEVASPIPVRIDIPTLGITANSLGTVGALVAMWYLASLLDRSSTKPRWTSSLFWIGLGLVSVIGAQYRTGYIGLAIAIGALLALRARNMLMVLIPAALIALSVWGPSVADELQPYVLRGQSPDEAAELSGRLEWWSLAGPVWEESPIMGKGLRTETRLILAEAGYDETSSIHSTWVEALIGTGLVGVACLGLSLLTALFRAFQAARGPVGRSSALVVLLILATRSVTGTGIEDAGYQLMVFLTVAAGLVSLPGARPRPVTENGPFGPKGRDSACRTSSRGTLRRRPANLGDA